MNDAAPKTGFTPLHIQLRNGRDVTVRTVVPEDKDALHIAIKCLSPESRYSRFMSPLHEATPQMLERAVNPEPGTELQLVAVFADGPLEIIIGGARYNAAPGSKDCEFAMAILDEWQGLGLTRRILEALISNARACGFEKMEGFILATNTRMLGLAERLGFVDVPSPEGPTVRLVRRDLL